MEWQKAVDLAGREIQTVSLGLCEGSRLHTETQVLMAARPHYSEEQVGRILRLPAEPGRVLNGLMASI
jgi:hypothetical protein